MYYRNSYMGPNQILDWLVNCSKSHNCTPMTAWCRLGERGICVNISPCHLIHSRFLLLLYRAWSMRLDLQCNGIKRIVSHLWARRIEPINRQTYPAGKLIKSYAYREEELCVSCPLVRFTPHKNRTFFGFLGAVAIDLYDRLVLGFGGRVGVN